MAPTIPSAKITLSYPLYACDFDPQDANRLVVGGGGGGGSFRSGIGNNISLLDVSRPDKIEVSTELELSRDEDAVNTLAVGQPKGRTAIVYAGVNSSFESLQKGKNEHFRVYGIDPASKTKAPRISPISKSSMFSVVDTETYQRLLRLSAPFAETAQLGAVGTGSTGASKTGQIALFDVAPGGAAPKSRGRLELPKEATDLDVIQIADGQYQLIYSSDYELYALNIGKGDAKDPENIYFMPDSHDGRPTFRSVRYLTPDFLLAATNVPKAGGAVLQGLRLPTKGQDKARISVNAKLPNHVTRATGLAVRNLAPTTSPSAKQVDTQFVVAVAAQDLSITVYTLEYSSLTGVNLISSLFPVATLKAVHPSPLTGLAFSTFIPPKTSTSRQQFIKLASVGSMGNTAVVHTFPLKKLLDRAAPARKGGPPRQARYAINLKSQEPTPTWLVIGTGLLVALIGFLLQGYLEIAGISSSAIGARNVVPASWVQPFRYATYKAPGDISSSGNHGFLAQYLAENNLAHHETVVLHGDNTNEGGEKGAGVKIVGHDAKQHADAKSWEELPSAQKAAWKDRLKSAGHWGEEMGETLFKGILFSELAGVVGHIVA